MIGICAEVTMVAGKVDIVNAGDEFTESKGCLLGIGFHGPMFTQEDPMTSWGVHPIGGVGSWRMVRFTNMKKIASRTSAVFFSCFAVFTLASLAGCACDEKHSSTSKSSSATTFPDSKDMTHRGDRNSR